MDRRIPVRNPGLFVIGDSYCTEIIPPELQAFVNAVPPELQAFVNAGDERSTSVPTP